MVFRFHYGLWYGGLVGIIPFMFNYASTYSGAQGQEHGLLYTVLPFAALVAKPVVGSFADRYAAHHTCLMFFILMTMIGYGSLAIYPFFPSLTANHKDIVWVLYCIAAFIGNTSMCVVNSIGDTLAINSCQRKNISYGTYRLWGPIGFGFFGAIWGVANVIPGFPQYTPGILTLVIILTINVLVLAFWQDRDEFRIIPKENNPSRQTVNNYGGTSNGNENQNSISEHENIQADKLHHRFRLIMKLGCREKSMFGYIALFTFCGIMTGIHWQYFFGYLRTISKDEKKFSQLVALTIPVQALGGELVFFMVSGKILKTIGPFITLILCLLSFSARYLLYAYFVSGVSNPFWILPVEILQGPAFGLMYSVLTHQAFYYSKRFDELILKHEVSQDGRMRSSLHATLQGLLGASFEGLGVGLGALIGGRLYDLDAVQMWKAAGFGSLLVSVICIIISVGSQCLSLHKHRNVETVDMTVA